MTKTDEKRRLAYMRELSKAIEAQGGGYTNMFELGTAVDYLHRQEKLLNTYHTRLAAEHMTAQEEQRVEIRIEKTEERVRAFFDGWNIPVEFEGDCRGNMIRAKVKPITGFYNSFDGETLVINW